MAQLPSLTGPWVASFIVYYAANEWVQLPWPGPPKAPSPPPLPQSPTPLERAVRLLHEDAQNIVKEISLLIPSNMGMLTCYRFAGDGTFTADRDRGGEQGFDPAQLNGTYTLEWRYGVPGGDIWIEQYDLTIRYLMSDADTLSFVFAHGPESTDPVYPAIGTMRRAKIVL